MASLVFNPGKIGVTVKTDIEAWSKTVSAAVKKQIPFATAASLTEVAGVARDTIRRQLDTRFKINSPWIAKGVTITPASKRDWPKCFSEVRSKDEFMVLQETGGVRTPATLKPSSYQLFDGKLAIPTRQPKRKKSGAVAKEDKPKAILKSKRGWRDGDRIRVRQNRHKAPVYYWLKDQATIAPRWGYRETAEEIFDEEWPRAWAKWIRKSIETKR